MPRPQLSPTIKVRPSAPLARSPQPRSPAACSPTVPQPAAPLARNPRCPLINLRCGPMLETPKFQFRFNWRNFLKINFRPRNKFFPYDTETNPFVTIANQHLTSIGGGSELSGSDLDPPRQGGSDPRWIRNDPRWTRNNTPTHRLWGVIPRWIRN